MKYIAADSVVVKGEEDDLWFTFVSAGNWFDLRFSAVITTT